MSLGFGLAQSGDVVLPAGIVVYDVACPRDLEDLG